MKILRHRTDLRSLLFLAVALTSLGFSLSLHLGELSIGRYLACLFLGIAGVFLVSLLNHNHRHQPIFYSAFLNRLINHLISLCIGAPSTRLYTVHNFNHHRHYRNEKDWTNYKVHAKSRGVFRILHYVFSASKEMNRQRKNMNLPKALLAQQNLERLTIWLFVVVAVIINPVTFFALILPVWLGGLSLLLTSNLFNHDGCDLGSDHNHSRNFLGPLENWFFMNNGFHSAHHAKPNLHWSLLPEFHRNHCDGQLNDNMRQRSFFLYFIKYIFKKEA